jgi:hypothetical protein
VAARGATGVAENKVGKNEEFSAPRKAVFSTTFYHPFHHNFTTLYHPKTWWKSQNPL